MRVRQWMPIRPVQPYCRASKASRRMRPAQSCGMVRPGSSSIHGMAHFGRPWTLANPGSTGVLPTVRLMQLIGMSLGRNSSNSAGLLRRTEHPAARGQRERRLDLLRRRHRRAKIGHRRVDLRLLHRVPRPSLGRPEPVVVQRMHLGDPPEHALVKLPARRPGRPGSCPPPATAASPASGIVSGVSVPMHVLMPRRRAKVNTSPRNSPIRSNRALHCSGDILFHGYVPRM